MDIFDAFFIIKSLSSYIYARNAGSVQKIARFLDSLGYLYYYFNVFFNVSFTSI